MGNFCGNNKGTHEEEQYLLSPGSVSSITNNTTPSRSEKRAGHFMIPRPDALKLQRWKKQNGLLDPPAPTGSDRRNSNPNAASSGSGTIAVAVPSTAAAAAAARPPSPFHSTKSLSGSVIINTYLRDNSLRGAAREKAAVAVAAAAAEAAAEAARDRANELRQEVRREFDGMRRACRRLSRGSSSGMSSAGSVGGGGGGADAGGARRSARRSGDDAHWRALVREYVVLSARGEERSPRALAIAKFVATVAARGEAVASFLPGAEGFVNGYILGPGYNDDGGGGAGGGAGGGGALQPLGARIDDGAAAGGEEEIGGEWRVAVRRNQVDVIFNSFNPGSDAERRRWRHVRRARAASRAAKLAKRKGSVLVDAKRHNASFCGRDCLGSEEDTMSLSLDNILQMHAESDEEWEE